MLTLLGSRRATTCDGSSRRDFLKVGALGLTGLLLPDLLRARAGSPGRTAENTSVIWLWRVAYVTALTPTLSNA